MSLQKFYSQFDDLTRKIDIKLRNETYQDLDLTSRNISDLKILLNSLQKTLDDVDREMSNFSQEKQREHISKVKILKSEYETKRTAIFKLEEKYISKSNLNKLSSGAGGVSKSDAKKAERDAVSEFDKNVNYQQELLTGIDKDMNDAYRNMTNIVGEVKAQGETITRVQVGIKDTEVSVKRADKNINTMQRRSYCQKFLLHLLAVVLFLGILSAVFYKLFK